MATLADSLVSSASRPLQLRVRPDLSSKQQRYHGRVYWVVKEPVGLNYFRFHEEEYAILQMLDGMTSMEEIKEQFEREFAPQKITYQDLQQFIGMLHRSGLVISESSGQGRQLKKRRDEKKRKEVMGKMANIFAVRFRGFDPERILNWLLPYTSWFFSPAMMLFVLMLAGSALLLVGVQFDVFRSRLPTFHEFFAAHNWIYMAVTMAVVKVMHEFGHGLSCKRYGGECHEIGLMLLVFTPCLYCNVSDSWMLPNKWHRAFIGAAGMYVEVFLASIATFVWWFSSPGMINQLSLSVMFICSVSTLMFNGNPLLRFDGYYILMDLLEIPNLRQKATEILKRFMVWLCLGIEQPENPFLPQRNQFFFGLYTVAAVIYRWVVVFSILYFLNMILEPYGLKNLGRAIAIMGFMGLVVQPLYQMGKFFYVPGRMHKVKRHRVVLTGLVVASVIGFLGWVPLPYQVEAVFTVKPSSAEPVFPRVAGQLREVMVRPGEVVEAQQLLARVDNRQLQLQLARLEGDEAQLVAQLDSLRHQHLRGRASADEGIGGQISQVREMLESTRKEIAEVRQELNYQNILAPIGGTVIPPEHRERDTRAKGTLPTWSGSPLDPKNRGATLSESDLFCRVGDPTKLAAELIIDQSVIDFVRPGQDVELKLEAYPHDVFRGTIDRIGDDPLQVAPPSLTAKGGGGLDTAMDESGVPRPLHPSYPARVLLSSDDIFQIGMKGRAKIRAIPQPLGTRLYRYISQTFHFEW
jgi:putative peptide zinc metalloprotease protein